jgi:NDP-sugar pyrophosphorylase family protein
VIESCNETEVSDYIEKPTEHYLVSMGIYIFEPSVLQFIEAGKRLDFPDLVKRLLTAKLKLAIYRSDDFWLDIGRPDDYQKAVEVFAQQRERFIGHVSP